MAPRAQWKGYLKLSLVSAPIVLYPAISPAERISFRQVNKATGNRLRQQMVDSVTGKPVQSHDKGRGYEVGENQFVIVNDEELHAAQHEARARPFSTVPPAVAPPRREEPASKVHSSRPRPEERIEEEEDEPPVILPPPPKIENNRTIELDRFMPRAQLDPRYYNTPYYIAPRDLVGQEAFAVIRDAMAEKDVVGMGRVVLANRERPIIVEAMGSGLRGITLRYAHEVRSETEYFVDIPKIALPGEMLQIAKHILDTKLSDFDPAYLEDRYRTVLAEKLREKKAHMPSRSLPASSPSPQNVINLMDALRRSLSSEKKPAARSVSKRARKAPAAPVKPAASLDAAPQRGHSRSRSSRVNS
jgi:DNA end-binding protein Ku